MIHSKLGFRYHFTHLNSIPNDFDFDPDLMQLLNELLNFQCIFFGKVGNDVP